MDVLLTKSKINKNALKSVIVKIAATELTKLSEPCYYPEIHKHQYELLRVTGLNDKDLADYVKRFWAGTKWAKYLVTKDKITLFFIFIMHYFLKEKDETAFSYIMMLFMVRFYTNLMHRQFPKFCDPDVFKYALDNLNKTHLFSREKTIPTAILFLSKQMQNKYRDAILNIDKDKIGKFIQESRTRMSQSIKSFAELYYRSSEEGSKIRNPYEGADDNANSHQYESIKKSERLIEEISRKITIYKFIDNKAMTDAKNISKIKMSMATLIVKTINDIKYDENLKSIYRLFIKDLNDVNSICGNKFFTYVKSLMSIKRTNELIYFKQQVNVLLTKILKELNYIETYNKLTSQSRFNMNAFLAYYLTMVLRNSLCS